MKNIRGAALIAAATTVALLAACAPTAPAPADSGASQALDLRGTIRIGLAAPAAALILPYMALDEGIFAEHGLDDVEVMFMPGPQLVPAAAGGAFEIAISAPPSPELTSLSSGDSLKGIATWGIGPGQFLVATEDIESPEDLKGRKIGINGTTAGSSSILMNYALREVGLSFEDVELVVLQDAVSQVQAYIGGQIDAMVTSEPSMSQVFMAREGSHEVRDFQELSYFSSPEILANTAWLGAKPDQAVALLAAMEEALQLWRAEPELAKAYMMEYLAIEEGDPLLDLMYDFTVDEVFVDTLQPLSEEGAAKLFALLRDSGFPEAEDELSSRVVDSSFFERAFE